MRVVNVNAKEYGGVQKAIAKGVKYCGRPTPLGNPYSMENDERKRDTVIQAYRSWLFKRLTAGDPTVITALEALEADDALGCFCAPKPCHCDVIVKAWTWWQQQRRKERD